MILSLISAIGNPSRSICRKGKLALFTTAFRGKSSQNNYYPRHSPMRFCNPVGLYRDGTTALKTLQWRESTRSHGELSRVESHNYSSNVAAGSVPNILLLAVNEAATICPRPQQVDLLTFKVVSESRVTWATSVPILAFLDLSVLDLGPMYATDRRQTDGRSASSLNAPTLGHNNQLINNITGGT